MSLEYKFSIRENITNLQTYIVDTSTKSTKYFRVSDVPQVLQKGKNLLRITAHPTNLVPGTQIYVDVRDSNGNPIYYEIPDYLENDKSRVISIWVYNDKGDDNTPNGEATITLVGIANSDLDGNPLPSIHRNKLNVKWQTTVTVDRERNNTSEVIFDPTKTPTAIISQSVERYENQPQDTDNTLTETTQTGRVKYFFSGTTPIIQTISFAGGKMALNSEMAGGSIILNNFEEPAIPVATIDGAQSSTFFSSSIKEILNSDTLKTETNFTTSFDNRPDVIHTYDFIKSADCEIQYVQSGSNLSTENKRNFANITLSDVDPITGLVDKIKVLHKSEGLPGGFELLNEVDVPFSSSFNIKIPIPSKNLNDPKIIKLLYLNSEGGISRTETISDPFIFDGDNLYIGGSENLISGSIFISNTLGTGIEIGGASSGFMRSVGYRGVISASAGKAPGGFIIYSGSGNLQVGEDVLPGVGMQFVGDNDARHLIFSTANGGLLDVKTDKFFIGNTNSQFISGSDGNIEISSSIFHLNPAANGGAGSLVIGANATILADLTVDNLRTPAVINGNASTETNSSSSIKADGFARFVSASIGGWGITTGSIEGGNLIMKPEGILQTRDFASGLKGWKISSEGNGTAEFENVRIRGTLRTTTFEKESVNAVGGQLWVANSTTITGSVTASETTMSVKNASGFAAGEILIIKKVDNTGFQTEYVLLNSASIDGDNSNEDETGGRIMIQRAYGSGTSGNFVGDLASAAQAYEDGQVIVSTGKLNSGYIKMNANPNDTDTPYMDIVERTGSGLYDVALKARLGDLKGLANSDYVFGDSNPGFGLATDNVFLQGGIIARTGSIGGIKMDAGKLFTGIHGAYANANTGFYVDSGSQFSLGNKLVWNPTSQALTIRGSLQLSDGTDVGTAIDNVSAGSLARSVELTADKYVITFDAFGNEAPSNQTITLTSSPQNFLGQAYYEYYKDGTIQGGRGTTTTFTVDTTLEKPTASTPVTYEVKAFNSASGGTVISTDSLTLFGLQPGADGVDSVTAFLTNESHTLPLSSSGVIQSFGGADTQIKVFEGVTDKTSNYTFTESSPAYITATSSSNTFTITNSTAPYSGSVTITAVSASVSLSKIMSIGISRQGDDGAAGTPGVSGDNAKTLIGSVDSQIFAFDDSTDNSATPGSITFAFSQQNLNDVIQASDITITTADSNTVTNFSFDSNSVSGDAGQKSGIVSGSVSFTGNFSSGGLNNSKDSLPLTISCTNDTLTDSVTVFKVEGGLAGTDAVTAFLTNESHTFTSLNNGDIVSFAGGSTKMEVFEGITNVTDNYVISSSNGVGMTASDSGNTVTISAMVHDSGSLIINASSGSVDIDKIMSLTKSKQGTAGLPGNAAKMLTITSDSPVFSFPSSSSSTAIDDTIELIINQQNLSATVSTSDLVIKDSSGNPLTDPALAPSSLTNNTGLVSGSITFSGTVSGDKTKLPLDITISQDGLTDSLKIFKVEGGGDGVNGTDAVSAFLTNESHTFPADFSGSIASFVGGSTDMEVFEGVTNSTDNYVISSSRGLGVVASDSGNTVTVTALGHDSGSVKITATSGSVQLSKTMSLTKARQGGDGSDGSSAKLLFGTLNSQVMAFDSASDSTSTPTFVEFSFQQQNLSAAIGSGDITIALNGGGNITGFGFDNSDVTNGTGIVSGSIRFGGANNAGGMGSNKEKFPVTISATKDGLQDAVKIFKVEGGADGAGGVDAITALLTNDSHTLPVSSSGNVISFAGASTDILVFQGTSDVTNNYTISRTSDSHITTTLSGDTVTITNSTTPFSGSVVITATSASVSLSKTMSISQALQGDDGAAGADGSSASLISLTGDSQVFAFPSSSATTPEDTTIELFVTQQNLGSTLHTSQITITDKEGNSYTTPTFSPGSLSNNSGVISGSLVFGTNTPTNKLKFPITITATSESLSDSFKVFALDGGADGTAGADAITVILSNESHTIAAASDGTVASFSGAETDVTIFEGVTDKTTNYFINGVSNTGITVDNDFNSFNSSSLNVTAMTNDSGSVIITSVSGGIHHSGWGSGDGENWATSQFVSNNSGDINGTDNDFYLVSSAGEISVGTGDGELRNNYVEFGNNYEEDNDEIWIVGKDIFAYDDTKTYYIEARFKRVLGTGGVFCGVVGHSSESVRVNKGGGNSFGSQHYIAANNFDFEAEDYGTDWITVRGYFSGHSTTSNNNTGDAPDINTPKSIHSNATYISPAFLCNYDNKTGAVRLDYIEIKEVKDGSGNLSAGTVKVDKTMTLAKSKAGTDGTPGDSAKTITISSDNQTFAFDDSTDNSATPTSIGFTINQQNLSGTIAGSDITITKIGGGTITTPTVSGTVTNGTGARTFTLPFSSLSKTDLPLSVSVTKDSVTDNTSIIKIEGGANGVSALQFLLTNEAHIVPATSAGVVSSYSNSGTEIYVYEGTAELEYDGVGTSNGRWKVGTPTISPSGKITVGTISDGGNYAVVANHSSMDNSTNSVTISYPISGKTSDGTAFSFTKTQTIAKSLEGAQGAQGSDSKTASLTAATNVITYNAAGSSPSPSSTITLTADSQNFTNGYFKFTGDGISDETSYTDGTSANQDTFSFSVPSSYFSSPKTIRVGVSEANQSELAFDTVTIVAVQPGAEGASGTDAVTAFLTSEADVVPAAVDGTVSSFAGSGTTMKVFEGITDKSTGAGYTYTVSNSTGLSTSLSNNVLTITGLTPDSGSATITAQSSSNGSVVVSIDKIYSIGKSKAGATGADNQDFGFLGAGLSSIATPLTGGLLLTSQVFGYHGAIGAGDGTNATLGDFTSFLDSSGNFYLGGGASGATDPSGGYFAWNNTNKSLLISGSNAEVKVDKFFLGNTNTQFISGSNGNIRISGDVEFEGRNSNGATVYYDNFASYTNGSAVTTAGNSPQVDGSGVGYYNANAGEITTINTLSTVGGYSGKVLRFGNNGGTDQVYIAGNKLIPFNENSLYELEVRYKIEIGSGTVYAGIVGYKSDGTTKVNVTGTNTLSSQHYLAVSGQGASVSGNDWVIRKGYFKGTAATGNGGQHNNDTDPGTLHSDVLNGYITPMFIGNYVNQGTVLLDYIKITEIGGGGSTKISGDSITTGVLKSNNLSNTAGSQFKLDDGTFKLGGHTSPKLEWDGTTLSVTGKITVSNPGDFADPGANVTTEAVFYKFGDMGAAPITSDNFYISNLQQNAITQTDGGTPISANKFESTMNGGYGAGWSSGYATKTTFSASLEPILSYDVVLNQGTNDGTGYAQYPPYHMFGFSDVDSDSDVSTSTNYSHLTHGIYITRKQVSSVYYNTFEVRENGGSTAANSDWYTVNGLTGNATNGPWISGEDTFYRFTIQLKKGGGAIYKAFKNGNFLVPVWSYVSTSTTHTGKHSFLATTYWGYNNGNRKEFITEQLAIGAAPAPGTIISGDGITAGTIVSTNLDANSGSQFKLDDGTFKLGGTTSPKLSFDGTTLSVKGNIQVEGGGFNSSAGELFGNPTGHLLDVNGRPGGWSAGYGNNNAATIKSTDLLDGNGAIVELSSTTDADIGMVSHAFPIEVQQNYKIRVELKADLADSNGLYIRIYEYDSELPAGKDSISNNSDGSSTSAANVQEDTRQNSISWSDDNGTAKTTENGPITTSYVSYNGTYTPTATAKYFSVVILNWSGMSPTETKLFLKSMNVRKVSQGTTITGAGISTGLIQSVNLNADSGSKINLDDGSMLMGGTGNPGFEVSEEGFVTATNIAEKFVIVNSSNKSQYFQNYSSNTKTRLILDGSLGGQVTMNLTIEEAPDYIISDIQFPSNVGSTAIADMELKIATDDPVTFDDNPSTGFYSGLKSLAVQLLSVALARN